jgi:hypothetical protein
MKKILSLFLIITLVAACKTHVDPSAPDLVKNTEYQPELSIINIPVEIPIKLLEDSLNAQINGLIVDDQSYDTPEKDDLKIKVWINGRIKTGTMNDVFYSMIPLKVWAQARYDACDFCPTIEKETNFEPTVYFSTKLSVSKDYRVVTTTTSNGFTWVVEPKIYIAGIGISIKSMVEKELDKTLKNSAKEMDRNISNGFDLRSQVQGIWNQLHTPIMVDSASQTYLKIKPKEFFMSPIKSTTKSLKLNLGVRAFLESYTGTKPEAATIPALPDLKNDAVADNSFYVNLTSRITYAEANKLANQSMANQSYQMGKKTVVVDSLHLSGNNNKLVVKTYVSNGINGMVYLCCRPEYDMEKSLLAMKDVDFDINTKNVLYKSAAWMIDGLFSKKLESKLVFKMSGQLDSIKTQINTQIADYRYQNLFTLKGKLDKLEVKGIYMEPDGIRVALSARGSANIIVGLTPTPPKKK